MSSTKEMALIAQIVFDNIVEDKQHDPGSAPNPPVISFDMWTGYFKVRLESCRGYVCMPFSSNAHCRMLFSPRSAFV